MTWLPLICCLLSSVHGQRQELNNVELDASAIPNQIAVLSEQIYLQTANKSSGNFVFSTLSLHSALTLLFMGATPGSKTQVELGALLGTVLRLDEGLLPFYSELLQNYKQTNFVYGNKVLINKEVNLKPTYKQRSASLGADIDRVDFSEPDTITELNAWVRNLTEGKINDLIASVDPSTQMLLVNAIYLKEEWTRYFTVLRRPVTFTMTDTSKIDVKMMERTDTEFKYGRFKYGDDQNPHEFITIPYQSEDFEMQIILPNANDNFGLQTIESHLARQQRCHSPDISCGSEYIRLFKDAKEYSDQVIKKIRLTMPLFSIDSTIDAGKIFQDLGATAMFTERGGLRNVADGPDLKVSNILQKAFISVNSEGTEAAAATFIEIVPFSADPFDLLKVVIDRPFIFMVYDRKNEIPIVMGRVTDPRS